MLRSLPANRTTLPSADKQGETSTPVQKSPVQSLTVAAPTLLNPRKQQKRGQRDHCQQPGTKLEETLASFGIAAKVINKHRDPPFQDLNDFGPALSQPDVSLTALSL
jgi:hypothetical protein